MWVACGLAVVCALVVMPGRLRRGGAKAPLFRGTGSHWRRNYGRRSFLRLGAALVAGAALAFSGTDEAVEDFHTGVLRSPATDRVSHVVNPFGERFWFLTWLLVAGIDAWFRSGAFSSWGRRNFEAMVVGLPALWTVQRGLGANRPSDPEPNPRWRPLADDNAASGHAFIAAIPWLNLARASGRVDVRWFSRAASTLTGWSRINDRKHYLSQVILGWVIAFNAVDAVNPPADSPRTAGLSKGLSDAA
jgi:membrane-associated phospholipid phosphatase